MNKTRNLFTLVGSKQDVSVVLSFLQFKGLITVPYGSIVTTSFIEKTFSNNKSIVCSSNDCSSAKLPKSTFRINVVPSNTSEVDSNQSICVSSSDIALSFSKIAESLGCDIGDHKSNSSGLTGGPTIQDCAYCKYLNGHEAENERTIYKSENFFVIPTLGEFITGYLLVIPYKHVMSNAELDYESYLKEFEKVLDDLEYLLKLTYHCPNVLIWENGSGKSGIGKAKDSVVHSHVHIAPSNLTSESMEVISGFPFETLTLEDLHKYKEHSYLLVRSPDKSIWKINNNPELYIPRQYVRQLIANEYDIPDDQWNWRKYPFKENMHQTVSDIKNAVTENWDILPERIKHNTSFLT